MPEHIKTRKTKQQQTKQHTCILVLDNNRQNKTTTCNSRHEHIKTKGQNPSPKQRDPAVQRRSGCAAKTRHDPEATEPSLSACPLPARGAPSACLTAHGGPRTPGAHSTRRDRGATAMNERGCPSCRATPFEPTLLEHEIATHNAYSVRARARARACPYAYSVRARARATVPTDRTCPYAYSVRARACPYVYSVLLSLSCWYRCPLLCGYCC